MKPNIVDKINARSSVPESYWSYVLRNGGGSGYCGIYFYHLSFSSALQHVVLMQWVVDDKAKVWKLSEWKRRMKQGERRCLSSFECNLDACFAKFGRKVCKCRTKWYLCVLRTVFLLLSCQFTGSSACTCILQYMQTEEFNLISFVVANLRLWAFHFLK